MYGGITLEQLTYNKSSLYSIGADVYAPFGDRFTLNYSLKLGFSKDYSEAIPGSSPFNASKYVPNNVDTGE